ncbi:NAD(P)/FAD-dependent oxidoreductase [Pedomonas mirosovicensis]|uniref:NAD(P)/FAD-dependent oxidoreductase n=1 Tax=Pedomonas mirosovicensis TaxID=2908641 RepID=UPI002166D4A9|nr:NAD(P)/FAD-dependent oxidoreductase [Pedomonas mirosovicensis]MCH8686041.1 NAD(P)/FAD-dependent oxidoreductase [Pedomonas mirosovicensis]
MTSTRPQVVIIGSGFAGLAAARGLGKARADVTIIDRTNHHLFQPLLYQVATAELAPGDIAQPIRHILRRHRNVRVLLGEATGIDPQTHRVWMGESFLHYDYLIIATGSRHSYFGNDAWARFAPGLKTIDDARRIRARVLAAFEQAEFCHDTAERTRLLRFVVIGGGPTGVEIAGALAELARHTLREEFRIINPAMAKIVLVEAGERILAQFPHALTAYAEQALARLGVHVLTRTRVTNINSEGVMLDGALLPAATVIWGAGVMATPVGQWLGVETDRLGRVTVDRDFSVPSLDGVYVLGDAALATLPDGTVLPGLAQVADQEGEWLGRALARRINGEPPSAPLPLSRQGQPRHHRAQRRRC